MLSLFLLTSCINISTDQGDFVFGKREGHGIYWFSNGSKCEGQWQNDSMNGRGSIWYANGNMYIGEIREGQINGKGILTYSDGDKYEGEFVNGRMSGLVSPVTLELTTIIVFGFYGFRTERYHFFIDTTKGHLHVCRW